MGEQILQQHQVEEADHQIKKRFDSIKEDSDHSASSSSSSTITDLMEDASSSSSSTSSLNGPLYELSTDLMDKLPLKRGLSRYYEGKSQSFTSLTSVRSLEDLAKREHPYNKRMRLSRSYGGGSDDHRNKRFCNPKPAIDAMKACSRGSCFSMVGKNGFVSNCGRPLNGE